MIEPSSVTVLEVAMEMAFSPEILNAVAEKFGPEAAQDAGMSTSVGGIGPLLRERVIAQGNMGIDVVGVSLLYDTVWSQGWHAWNHLFIHRKPVGQNLRRVLEDTGLTLNFPLFDGEKISVKVWKALYGKAPVYFLDCPSISNVVYPCEEDAPAHTPHLNEWAEKQRLKQSWLVGRGALYLMRHLGKKPHFVTLSETPTLFAHPTLFKDEIQSDAFFEKTKTIFNDHTPLEYAHPIWHEGLLDYIKMDPEKYKPFVKSQKADVTQILVAESDGVFGVAKKHAHVMRAMPSLRPYEDKIQSITNGVSREIWQAPVFKNPASLSDDELLKTKDRLRETFLDWLWRRANLWPNWAKTAKGKPLILWTRRITSYKRLDLLHTVFRDGNLRRRFLASDLVLVVGGRVYQRDNVSEKMVYDLVEILNGDQDLWERVVFLHNFNVYDAPRLFHGADGAVMMSNDGREASATGFMKSQTNGGLIIANPDGAVPEFVRFRGQHGKPNGFGVTYSNGEPDMDSFIRALEGFHEVFKNPSERAAMMREALAVTDEVDVNRTSRETLEFYGKLSGRS